ncbi:thiol-disulfide oxidoreductase DCC family protein [Ureibacillus acetophenoni]|uniref:Predicted DCC family thiol-disulfide oxidoreductase YuxK n=1 Tax=Ureibacillus acetophenoni TaxID=614649 RepID=A0A285UFX6_9BACL|nr:thiol-disulfide oxidoreductase DCC family protein [Ureibacillus acetophenoni]SOC40673.1 predicted DCC family thiol-disulfide oxidoreductase YuxK [Ureibacillus acetophenoni]
MKKIILFDGECNFCDASVQFIIKRDTNKVFQFASLQSDIGKGLLNKYNAPENLDSFVLIDGDKYFLQSTAALRVCKDLKGAYKLLYFFVIVPKPMRNFVYQFIAKNRYKWFGKNESCMIPSPEDRQRFL